jgi:LmbE family N-acetylglucosaminyl deacetylase
LVTFDHRESGTAEADWKESEALNAAIPFDLFGVERLVIVSAHPDDETLGCGGLIAAAAESGIEIYVIIATFGEGSHPNSTTIRPDVLAERRQDEVIAALRILAPDATVQQLALPDGHLADYIGELEEEIWPLVRRAQADTTWIISPWLEDGHPDHAAAASAASSVARQAAAPHLQYPLWAWHWGTLAEATRWPALRKFDLTLAQRSAKLHALAEHVTQVTALSNAPGDEAILSPDFLEHFLRDAETFFVGDFARRPAGTSVIEIDFAGLVTGNESPVESEEKPSADNPAETLTEEFFNDFYEGSDDPWGFATRWYEQRKRAITLASLPRERYRRALEIGSSIGLLSAELATRTDELLATDIAAKPLAVARERLKDVDNVTFEKRTMPEDWPNGDFDLIVVSEVGYYLSTDGLGELIRRSVDCLTGDGVLIACHWRHQVKAYPLNGDSVHDQIREQSGLEVLATHEEEDFILEVFVRPPAESVARATGLLD